MPNNEQAAPATAQEETKPSMYETFKAKATSDATKQVAADAAKAVGTVIGLGVGLGVIMGLAQVAAVKTVALAS